MLIDRQQTLYKELLHKKIPELVKEYSTDLKKYTVDYELLPISETDVHDVGGTKYITANVLCTLVEKATGDEIQTVIELLKIPVLGKAGFTIKGNNMQILDLYNRVAGWIFENNDDIESEAISSAEKDAELQQLRGRAASLYAVNRPSIKFVYTASGIQVVLPGSKKKVPLVIFLTAVTDYSNEDLLEMFGTDNKYLMAALEPSSTKYKKMNGKKAACIKEVHSLMFPKDKREKELYDKKNDIMRSLFDKKYTNLSNYYADRLTDSMSFRRRAQSKTLLEDVKLLNRTVPAGTILTDSILEEMDALPINKIKVGYNGRVYTLCKFSNLNFRCLGRKLSAPINEVNFEAERVLSLDDLKLLNASKVSTITIEGDSGPENVTRRAHPTTLHQEDILTALGMYINILNNLDTFDKQYELTNRIAVTFDKKILEILATNLGRITYKIENSVANNTDTDLLLQNINNFAVNTDEFIATIIGGSKDAENHKESQMSDLNNSLHYLSKSYKIVTDISNKSSSKDMKMVQDTQLGRTDPIDSPESAKIGLVHERTLFARETPEGYLTAPYVKVKNCEVVSHEPVYLTAQEEQDLYIAEWSETFRNPDGSIKEYVQARYNGSIVTIESSAVTLKEYTQLQTMSPARSLIPFQGNSNAKRLLMACNHQKQALNTVKTERAIVGTGAECLLDIGNYKGIDILNQYLTDQLPYYPELEHYRDEILKSTIYLVPDGIYEAHNTREYTFAITKCDELVAEGKPFKNTVTIYTQYLQKTAEKSIYTFRIKPQDVYNPDDIVLYNMSYDLKEYDINVNGDYGEFSVPKETFRYAYGTGRNLVVAYKTWESASIDDALVISSDLVYEDTETTITIMSEDVTLHKGEGYEEHFCKYDVNEEHHLASNGIVKVGSILKAGDVFACVVKQSTIDGTIMSKNYKRVSDMVEGQVISADIIEKDGETTAIVKIASRSAIEEGDKMSGRCGNKGVVARIVPAQNMPFNPITGQTIDIILNPLGIPSRMNVTQLLEVTLAYAMRLQGEDKITIQAPYYQVPIDVVRAEAEKAGVKPMMLRDGRTGRMFDRPINVGIQYMNKLVHRVAKKMAAIGFNAPTDATFGQPLKGASRDGGQSFGEMEAWCLQGMGANKVLQSLYSTQSDDKHGRETLIEAIKTDPLKYNYIGENHNDYIFQTFTRCLGIDVTLQDGVYLWEPLRDCKIRSLASRPVITQADLHNASLFADNKEGNSKVKWGFIELNTKIVSPYWLEKGSIHTYFIGEFIDKNTKVNSDKFVLKPFSEQTLMLILQSELVVDFSSIHPVIYTKDALYMAPDTCISGMQAIVTLFETYDINVTMNFYEAEIAKREQGTEDFSELQDDKAYLKLVSSYYNTKQLKEGTFSLADFVVTSWPVMPEAFRQKLPENNRMKSSDFDKSYRDILKAAAAIKVTASQANVMYLVREIDQLIGLNKVNQNASKIKNNRTTILSWFAGGKDSGGDNRKGKVRTRVLSKRLFCSGRSVIIPPGIKMKPTEIGIPIAIIVKIFNQPLISYLSKKFQVGSENFDRVWQQLLSAIGTQNPTKFRSIIDNSAAFREALTVSTLIVDYDQMYEVTLQEIIAYIEGKNGLKPQVVIAGRQPSLHKFSIRAFNPIVVFTKAIQVHTLVCGGYNADFDGDTMWVAAIYGEEAQEEAIRLMSPAVGVISPKDSEAIMAPQQDVVLGTYCATMLKDNVASVWQRPEMLDDIRYYTSIQEIREDVRLDLIKYYTLCIVPVNGRLYFSTAGRILFNDCLSDGFTSKPFSNPLNLIIPSNNAFRTQNKFFDLKYDAIIAAKGGTRKDVKYANLNKVCADIFNTHGTDCVIYYQKITEFGFEASDKSSVTLSLDDVDVHITMDKILSSNLENLKNLDLLLDKNLIDITQYKKQKSVYKDIINLAIKCSGAKQKFSGSDTENVTKILEGVESNAITNDLHKKIIEDAETKIALLQDYYRLGLLSQEDRKQNTAEVYKNACNTIKKILPLSMDRNNNLFIIFDSGSRGNIGQLMQTAGAVGILQKSSTENMENAITTNYTRGLSSFDMHTSSYSGRVGVISTQDETPSAGYATRIAVNMEDAVRISADDCGKQNWFYDVKYDKFKEVCWKPSRGWFVNNLLGKRINTNDKVTLAEFRSTLDENSCLTEQSFNLLRQNGLTSISIIDDTGNIINYEANLTALDGAEVRNEEALLVLKYYLIEGKINTKCIDLIQKHHLSFIETDKGEFHLKYDLDPIVRSLLLNRVASPVDMNGLPGLRHLKEVTHLGKTQYIITEETVEDIMERSLTRVPARILLDCRCKNSVCARCYGLKYSDGKFPEVGENVGVEAAQAIGEPAAQLTMSLFHTGGAAGTSIAGGVDVLHHLLEGGNPGGSAAPVADISNRTGYIYSRPLDQKALVFVKPTDSESTLCKNCRARNLNRCPIESNDYSTAMCKMAKVTAADMLYEDLELVHAGEAITKGFILPNNIKVTENNTIEEIMRRKQVVWLETYFNTFYRDNGIYINARHFEILVRLQNIVVRVLDSPDDSIEKGEPYEIFELIDKYGSDTVDKMKLSITTSKQEEVVKHSSGMIAMLSFQNVAAAGAEAVVSCTKDSVMSPISATFIGNDLTKPNIRKRLNQPNIEFNLDTVYDSIDPEDFKLTDTMAVELTASIHEETVRNLDIQLDDLDLFSADSFNEPELSVDIESHDTTETMSSMNAFANKPSLESDESELPIKELKVEDMEYVADNSLSELDIFTSAESSLDYKEDDLDIEQILESSVLDKDNSLNVTVLENDEFISPLDDMQVFNLEDEYDEFRKDTEEELTESIEQDSLGEMTKIDLF